MPAAVVVDKGPRKGYKLLSRDMGSEPRYLNAFEKDRVHACTAMSRAELYSRNPVQGQGITIVYISTPENNRDECIIAVKAKSLEVERQKMVLSCSLIIESRE